MEVCNVAPHHDVLLRMQNKEPMDWNDDDCCCCCFYE